MKRRDHSTSAKLASYSFHDDSRHATVMLGPRFVCSTHGEPAELAWPVQLPLAEITVQHCCDEPQTWRIACEFDEHFQECRAKVTSLVADKSAYLHLTENFALLADVEELKDVLPESVFGCLLGVAAGAREGLVMSHARKRRDDEPSRHHVPRSDWRAPKFSYTLRTATGSPFAEQWGFAIQEAVRGDGGFRLWVEQQRTGREVYLRLRSNGSIEGLQELEQLPAAVHGAGLGTLLAFAGVNAHFAAMKQTPAHVVPADVENGKESAHMMRSLELKRAQ
jgi:hypothetical protein